MKYQRHLVEKTNEFKKRRSKNNNSGSGGCLNDEWIKVH